MKIAILSDTHGSLEAFNRAMDTAGPCDLILHAGDILYHGPRNPLPEGYNPKGLADAINSVKVPFIAAAGNCDAPIDQMVLSVPIQSPYALVSIDNFQMLITHGHLLPEEELTALAEKWNIKLIITGHTHVKRLEKKNGLVLLNPGSCALPKDDIASIAIYEGSSIKLVNIENKEVLKSISI